MVNKSTLLTPRTKTPTPTPRPMLENYQPAMIEVRKNVDKSEESIGVVIKDSSLIGKNVVNRLAEEKGNE